MVKGSKLSDEHKRKLSEAKTGCIPWNKGLRYKHRTIRSLAHRKKISEILKLQWENGFKKGGWQHTEETKKKISLSHLGAKSYSWKGGVTNIHEKIRKSREYKKWRKRVFERDDYRCYDCGQRGGKLEADHIYPFSIYPRLRLMIENGRTLCKSCHRKTETWGGNSKNKEIIL